MNQTQRKYLFNRVDGISNTQRNKVHAAFANLPESRNRPSPRAIYPTVHEILQTLLGDPVAGVTMKPKEEILSMARNVGYLEPVRLAEPKNKAEIDEAARINEGYNDRHRNYTQPRYEKIAEISNRTRDYITLCNEAEAMEALKFFEEYNFVG